MSAPKDAAEKFAKKKPIPQKVDSKVIDFYNRELWSKGLRVKTLEDLLEAGEVDLEKWYVDTYTQNSWEQNSSEHGLVTLFQVKAKLNRRAPVSVKRVSALPKPIKRAKGRKKKLETALFMPDTQHGFIWGDKHDTLIPLHDYLAIDAFIQLAIKLQPDYLFLLGDHFDGAEWSVKYKGSPRERDTTQPALDVLNWHLVQLRLSCPQAKIIYLEGNHDTRMERAMNVRLEAARHVHQVGSDVEALSLPHLLRLDDKDIHYHGPYGTTYWLWGEIECTHGSSSSIEGEARKATHSRINGHVHRRGVATRTVSTPEGIKRVSIVNPGTLARIDGTVPSATVGKACEDWQQGAALAHFIDGNAHFQILPIEDGLMIYDGEVIRGVDRVAQIARETGWKQLVVR